VVEQQPVVFLFLLLVYSSFLLISLEQVVAVLNPKMELMVAVAVLALLELLAVYPEAAVAVLVAVLETAVKV
jgi:hypothetical protein